MDPKILIWNLKGGCGKTAISIALAHKLGYPVITNDNSETLRRSIKKDRLLELKKSSEVPIIDCGVIFDFGGFLDNRIVSVSKECQYMVIPIIPEPDDLQRSLQTIFSLREVNKDIKFLVVVNRVKSKGQFEFVKTNILKRADFCSVFELKESRALPNQYYGKSISEMMNNPLLRYAYSKVSNQIDLISEFILKGNKK